MQLLCSTFYNARSNNQNGQYRYKNVYNEYFGWNIKTLKLYDDNKESYSNMYHVLETSFLTCTCKYLIGYENVYVIMNKKVINKIR